jgi:uncharacterized protein DUF6526
MPNELPSQTFKNHARVVPGFHYVLLPLLLFNVVWTTMRLWRHPSSDTAVATLVGVCLVLLALFARMFAMTVQDRVIRLEMQLRLIQLCPPDLAARIPEFSRGQLVALRFASDAELPALARKVLDEKLEDRKTIKKMVKDWKADHLRA